MKFGFRSACNCSKLSHRDVFSYFSNCPLLSVSAFGSIFLVLALGLWNGAWGQTSSNHTTLSPAGIGANNLTNQPQMITNISKQGTYKVEIQWHTPQSTQTAVLPKNGFQLEIRFLNGSAPSGSSKNVPQKELQSTETASTVGVGTQYSVPGSIERLVPISSYDMTIYDNHGGVLWNKANQSTSAGVGLEQVVLPNSYTGKIHIHINNIKSNNVMTGSNLTPLSTPQQQSKSDSVDITAQVR